MLFWNRGIETMNQRMNIYITTGKRNLKYAYVAIKSLFQNNCNSEIYLYIVSEDLTDEDIKWELKLAEEYGHHIIILRFDEKSASKYIQLEEEDHWPIGTMSSYWLFHELLPEDVDRIMVIESDTVIIGDLSDLYATDFEGNYVICPGAEHKPVNHRNFMKELQGETITFVLSMYDVKKIREDFTLEEILAADEKIKRISGKSQMEFAFGLLFKGKVKYFPGKESCIDENERYVQELGYDYLIESEKTAKIIHFSSYSDYSKPWNPVFLVPGYKIWWDYAQGSPYYKEYFEQQWHIYNNHREDIEKIEKNVSYRNVLFVTVLFQSCFIFCYHVYHGQFITGGVFALSSLILSVLLAVGIRFCSIKLRKYVNGIRSFYGRA